MFRRADWRDDLSAYVDDELSPRERERVAAQLADSAEMQEYLADLQQMRSVLRSFDTAPSSVPFQLTPEMINDPARVPFQPTVAARALRLSMSTAAVGVATFAAVMIFDAVDSPTVTFTTTSAGDSGRGVPTAAVVTDEVEVEVEAQAAADAEPSAVTAVSATSADSGRESASQAESAEQREVEQSAPADATEVAQEKMQAEQQASVAAVDGEAEQQEAAQQAAYEEEAEQRQAMAEQASEDAASDPSRRALTAGSARGESDAAEVTAESVVAQQQASDAAQETNQDDASTTSAPEATGSIEDASTDSTAAESPERDRSGGQERAAASTQSETRTVATSVTHTESDWPLEQRPRSSTVQLATDPSWERPVQIVLAAIAISATVFWLVLTIVDRRRRA
ncbi:MAG: zf-HC2 domain-containing protein [Chloroflexi bacterium]|nr:zf-HC2 domain-containing protein [Chloroflexota bacterium]